MTEQGHVRYGNTTIHYEVSRSRRRTKTVEITVDGSGGVSVAAPLGTPLEEIEAILRKRSGWIVNNTSNERLDVHSKRFVSGETLPYLGRRVQMIVTDATVRSPRIHFRHWRFEVQVPRHLEGTERAKAVGLAFRRWYSERARDRITRRVAYWSDAIGCEPGRVLIRDQKQRWASCSPDGTLRFNWRVIMAEPSLMDYVVVHELAHLAVKIHSPEFWNFVAAAIPDYATRRRRLREAGPSLSV